MSVEVSNTKKTTVPEELFNTLSSAFDEFQKRSEKLEAAYYSMQSEFKKVNIELEKTNRELEESLQVQEETKLYLNSILESMNNGVIAVDVDARITLFNSSAEAITGFKSKDLIGNKFTDIFDKSNFSENNVMSILQSGKNSERDEKVIWNSTEKPVPVSYQSSLLKDIAGTRIGAVEIFSDISQIKDLEKKMQQSKTMAALGEMSATVAHEIRNPLGAMGVWAGLLNRDIEKGDPRKDTLAKIISALGRLNKIVSNLLVYSRPVQAQFRKVNLADILNESIDFAEIESMRLGYSIEFVKKWSDENELLVLADPEKLHQIIMNLAINSVQSMSEGGVLTVECSSDPEKYDGFVSFVITDTGCGIDSDKVDKIFDPFHTTKENGTGLGLAIVKKFIDYHSGHISVKSQLGIGTSISVFLPSSKGANVAG